MNKIIWTFWGIVFFYDTHYAQDLIKLREAIDTAVSRNGQVRNAQLKANIRYELVKSASFIPKTSIQFDYGQFNSSFDDHKLSISQTMPFPSVMAKQKKLKLSDYNLALLDKEIAITQLKQEVARVYMHYLILKKKEILWRQMDSMLYQFVTKTELKYEKGDANLLEKTSAVQHQHAVRIELDKVTAEIKSSLMYFNFLLNGHKMVQPDFTELGKFEISSNHPIENHPVLNFQKEFVQNAELQTKALIAQKMPDLNIGVSSTTIQGVGADNVLYTSSNRFNAATFGIQIPIFVQGINAQIRSARLNQKMAESQLEWRRSQMELKYSQLYTQFTSYKSIVQRYEDAEIASANILLTLASKQLVSGEISYLEWSILAQQSMHIRFNYIDALTNLYENYIQLKYFTYEN